jgi:toxin CptA
MTVALASLTFLLAAICAALMGYAIQRGATCTVAAVGEIVQEGRAGKLVALGEAALWVAGGLLMARALGLTMALPTGFAISGWTVAGGVLLGIGAWANRACVFGSIAKLGSGHWAYALTPVGFYVGAVSLSYLFPSAMPSPSKSDFSVPQWLAFAFVLFAVVRIARIGWKRRSGRGTTEHIWGPHESTILIGITFTILFVSVGAWTYTDLLMRLAHGMANHVDWQLALFAALLLGAVLGGWAAGRLSSRLPNMTGLVRCFTGGMLMGWGSALIPGGNDGLILVGMPLLMPYAWVAILTMCGTIWIALKAEQALKRG